MPSFYHLSPPLHKPSLEPALGARFGPFVGFVVGGLGFFLGAYISHIIGADSQITLWHYIEFYYFGNQSLDFTPGYPILKSYFNLSLILVGFVTGLAFFKTAGHYVTRHSLFIAVRSGIAGSFIAGLAIFLVLLAWRAFSQVTLFIDLGLKFWISCIPALLLLPFLLFAENAIARSYERVIERRRKKIHAGAT